MRAKIAPVALRLVARQERTSRATGLALARAVAERRRTTVVNSATRLAQGRSLVARAPETRPQAAAPEPGFRYPEFVSPFAASVLFGDESLADAEAYEQYTKREEARLARKASGVPIPRGVVEELGAEEAPAPQFKLSRRPAAQTADELAEAPPASAPQEPEPESGPAAQPEAAGPVAAPELAEEPVAAEEVPEPQGEPRLARTPVPLELREQPKEDPKAAPARPTVARKLSRKRREEVPPEKPQAEPRPPEPRLARTPAPESDGAPPEPDATPRAEAPEPAATTPAAPAPVPIELKETPPAQPVAPVPRIVARRPAEDEHEYDDEPEDAVLARTPAEPIPAPEAPQAPTIARAAVEEEQAEPPAETTPEPAAEATEAPEAAEVPEALPAEVQEEDVTAGEPVLARSVVTDEPREPAKPDGPVPIRVARREAPPPARPAIQRRPAEPPPIVEAAQPAPAAPAGPAPSAPKRGILRRLADSVQRRPPPQPPLASEPAEAVLGVQRAPVAAAAPPRMEAVGRPEAAPLRIGVDVPAAHERPEAAVTAAEAPVESSPAPRQPLLQRAARLLRLDSAGVKPPEPPGLDKRPEVSVSGTPPAPAPAGGDGGPPSGGRPVPGSGGQSVRTIQRTSLGSGSREAGSVDVERSAEVGDTSVGGPVASAQGVEGGTRASAGDAILARAPAESRGSATAARIDPKAAVTVGAAVRSPATAHTVSASGAPAVSEGTVPEAERGGVPASQLIARTPADRPAPVPIENVRVEAPPPTIARAPAPPPDAPQAPAQGTSGFALAAATGATIARHADGTATVSVAGPEGLPSLSIVEEPTIAREAIGTAAPARAALSAAPRAAQPAGAPAEPDLDELAEKVMEVLRREAIVDLERHGYLGGELP